MMVGSVMLTVPVSREHLQQDALERQQPGQGDDERRHPEPRGDQPLEQPDGRSGHDAGRDRQVGRPAVLGAQHSRDRRRHAAHGTDREVDLAEQQHQHDADRDQADAGDLKHQVGEVGRRQEAGFLQLEDRPDHDQAEDHPDLAEVALHEATQEFHARGRDLGRRRLARGRAIHGSSPLR